MTVLNRIYICLLNIRLLFRITYSNSFTFPHHFLSPGKRKLTWHVDKFAQMLIGSAIVILGWGIQRWQCSTCGAFSRKTPTSSRPRKTWITSVTFWWRDGTSGCWMTSTATSAIEMWYGKLFNNTLPLLVKDPLLFLILEQAPDYSGDFLCDLRDSSTEGYSITAIEFQTNQYWFPDLFIAWLGYSLSFVIPNTNSRTGLDEWVLLVFEPRFWTLGIHSTRLIFNFAHGVKPIFLNLLMHYGFSPYCLGLVRQYLVCHCLVHLCLMLYCLVCHCLMPCALDTAMPEHLSTSNIITHFF